MEYVMLIFESPADFEARTEERGEPFRGAWRAYFQAMVDAGVYVDGRPLHAGARGTTISSMTARSSTAQRKSCVTSHWTSTRCLSVKALLCR